MLFAYYLLAFDSFTSYLSAKNKLNTSLFPVYYGNLVAASDQIIRTLKLFLGIKP